MTITIEEILRATGGQLLQGDEKSLFQRISTDSRTIGEGELFVALKGRYFDGHRFALEVLAKRAGGVVIEEDQAREFRWNGYRPKAVIAVKDTPEELVAALLPGTECMTEIDYANSY